MSRARKKIDSDSDERVSIFDSEQDQPVMQSNRDVGKLKSSKIKEKIEKKARKPSSRNIEKKLSKDEESIMKSLLNEQNRQRDQQTIKEQKTRPEPKKQQPKQQSSIKSNQHYNIKPQYIVPPANLGKDNLDLYDINIEDAQLTWLDLQQLNLNNLS